EDFGAQLVLLRLEGGIQLCQRLLQALGGFGVLRKKTVALAIESVVQVGQHGTMILGQCRFDAGWEILRRHVKRGDSPEDETYRRDCQEQYGRRPEIGHDPLISPHGAQARKNHAITEVYIIFLMPSIAAGFSIAYPFRDIYHEN